LRAKIFPFFVIFSLLVKDLFVFMIDFINENEHSEV